MIRNTLLIGKKYSGILYHKGIKFNIYTEYNDHIDSAIILYDTKHVENTYRDVVKRYGRIPIILSQDEDMDAILERLSNNI
jgi:hypothetical protein